MKLLTVTAACMAALITSKMAAAQTVCYDPLGPAATVFYNPAAGYNLFGDILTSPCNNVTSVDIAFVATAAGNYNIGFDVYPTNCLGCPAGPPIPVTIPPGGAFPSVWIVTLNGGGNIQFFSVTGDSNGLWPTFVVNNPPLANGVDGISADLNPTNGCLLTNFPGCGGNEWYGAGNQTNVAVTFTTTPSPLAALHGPLAPSTQVTSVRRSDVPAVISKSLAAIKPN